MDWIARVGTPETEEFRREEILRRLFVWWDIDGSGRIDQGEVEQVLVTFKNGKAEHVAALKQRWKGLLSGGTIPANGQMSESRFVHAFATLLADFSFSEFEAFLTHVEETLQFILSLTETNRRRLATCKLFAAWDSSGSGWLDSDEVERILLATPWGDENQQTISLLFERVYEAHQDKQKTEDVDLQEFGTIFKCLFRDCSEQQFNDICRQLRQAIKHDHDPDKHIVARFMSKKKARSRSPSPPLPSTQSAPDSTHTTSCTNVRSRSPTGGLLSAVMIPPPTSSSSSRSTSPYKYPPLSGGQSTSPSPPLTDSQQQYDDQYVIQQRIKALKQDIKHCFDGLSYDEVDACFVTGKSLPPYYEIVAAPVCLLLHISPRADKSGEVRYWSGLEGVLQSDYVNFLGLLHNYQDIPISNEMVMRLQAYCSEVSFSYNYLVGHQSHFLAALSKWLSTLVELTCLQHAWEYPPPSLPTDIRHLQHDDHPTTRLRANQLPPVPYNNTTNTPITQDHPPPPSRESHSAFLQQMCGRKSQPSAPYDRPDSLTAIKAHISGGLNTPVLNFQPQASTRSTSPFGFQWANNHNNTGLLPSTTVSSISHATTPCSMLSGATTPAPEEEREEAQTTAVLGGKTAEERKAELTARLAELQAEEKEIASLISSLDNQPK